MNWLSKIKAWLSGLFSNAPSATDRLPDEPTPAVEISRKPGIKCPECATHLVVSIQNLVNLDPIQCPNCGLELTIDVEKSQSALESLKKLQSGLDQASRVKENPGY